MSGKVSKGVPYTSHIYHSNDSGESFGVTGSNNFGISCDDIGRGNSLTTHFDSSTVESEHGFSIQSVDSSRSGVSHNSTLSLPNVDDMCYQIMMFPSYYNQK